MPFHAYMLSRGLGVWGFGLGFGVKSALLGLLVEGLVTFNLFGGTLIPIKSQG